MAQQNSNNLPIVKQYFTQHKAQLAAALPRHINPDRMIRLALTAFSQNKKLAECRPDSIFASVIVASQLGLEIGIDGQGYLVPYKGIATFVPGWKGYVDLISRAGRATVWTGAVYEGDQFDYALGDSPFINHKPGDNYEDGEMTHTYAVGRVKDSDWPVIEVWPIGRVWKHRDKHNKVGKSHYSFGNEEMYARKVSLMQVMKYMPKSIELTSAMEIDRAATQGQGAEFINGDFVIIDREEMVADVNSMIADKTAEKQDEQPTAEPTKSAATESTEATEAQQEAPKSKAKATVGKQPSIEQQPREIEDSTETGHYAKSRSEMSQAERDQLDLQEQQKQQHK